MSGVYRAEDVAAVAEQIAAATGSFVEPHRDGELFRVARSNLFIVDRLEDGVYRLQEFERGQVQVEVHSDGFDPIVRVLTFLMARSGPDVRYDPDWESARLDPRFRCDDRELTWPADAHGSWVRNLGGMSRLKLMEAARSMLAGASIEEITQAVAHPEPGGLLDGMYRLA